MINKKMYELGSNRSAIRDLFEYGKTLANKIGKENVFDFTLGNPSVPCPNEVNEYIANLVLTDAVSTHGYTSAQGDLATREAIVNYNARRYGFTLDANLIYMTCGAAAALTIVLRSIISNEGEEVVAFAPYFPEYKVFVENAGGTLKVTPADEVNFETNFDMLKKIVSPKTQAVIINSPNNPSGTVYSEETIIKLSKFLNEKQAEYGHPIYLLADEPYREILFDGATCPFLPKYYDNTIICYSYSKALSLPGERIGYIAVSPKCENASELYYAVCGAGRSLGYVCAPSLFQKVVAKYCDVTSNPQIYKDNRDELISMLTSLGFSCVNPKGAFYLFMKSPISDAKEFSNYAKTLGLLLVPSDTFGVEGYVRLATCVSKETVVNSKPAFTKLAEKYLK